MVVFVERRVRAPVQRRAASMALSYGNGKGEYLRIELECMRRIHPNRTCLKNDFGACFPNAC